MKNRLERSKFEKSRREAECKMRLVLYIYIL